LSWRSRDRVILSAHEDFAGKRERAPEDRKRNNVNLVEEGFKRHSEKKKETAKRGRSHFREGGVGNRKSRQGASSEK